MQSALWAGLGVGLVACSLHLEQRSETFSPRRGRYTINVEQRDDERPGMYQVALGYDFRLSASTIAIIDAVRRENELRDEPAENFGELGIRYAATPLLVLSAGAGAGASDDGGPARHRDARTAVPSVLSFCVRSFACLPSR